MRRNLMKSKLHRVTVTDAHLDYMGSITIDRELMEAVDILPFERVHVLNLDNGARVETYVIVGKRGSGQIRVNGAAARFFSRHDRAIIIAYADLEDSELPQFHPRVAFVDQKNKLTEIRVGSVRPHRKLPSGRKGKTI
jgi:aspartate 1-decarboxylase